jgi:hypothetical protein
MNLLCVSTDLTSAEWAAWAQAIGTILAVLAAAGIAIWQSRVQHRSALLVHQEEQRYARLEMARTLHVLGQNCTKAAGHFRSQMQDRESIHKIASGETYFDFSELNNLQNATTSIPLYTLPHSLVTYAMVLGATMRQLRQTIDMAIKPHRSMDAQSFNNLFNTLDEINESLRLTCDDVHSAVMKLETS